jgi:hypothetical protein
VSAVRAFEPFGSEEEAAQWLDGATAEEEKAEALLVEGLALLNRALHAHGAASGDPRAQELGLERGVAARIGYGSGEEVAASQFSMAREVGAQSQRASRQRRDAELRPQERIAAVLGGRERLDACETLLPRARADLDAGREREAALQLRVGLEALLVELKDAVSDPGHERDMGMLRERRGEMGEAANSALRGPLSAEASTSVRELLDICERVLRRRRVLDS